KIDFNSGHVFRIGFSYASSTNVLNETVTDTVSNATFSTSYNVDILAHVGSNVAYVGFTGGTGGETATQDVLTWAYQFTPPRPGEGGGGSGSGGGSGVPQLAAGGPAADGAPALTAAELAPVAQEAVARWAATGLSAAQVAELKAVPYQITALGGRVLGVTGLGATLGPLPPP